ncbi:hypothetical protein vBEfaSHEf13_078 [Enterococcus phage vB_EfaS_HEf13]|nr:hypothetical protein vBEfaSHEf13_078 [Enterococcus phage vB_EfaS_HEf13]
MFLGRDVDFHLITSGSTLEADIRDWIKARPNVKIVDIKYSSNKHSDRALIIYEKASTMSRQEAYFYGY